MGKMRNAYEILVAKPEGKRPLGKPWHKGNVRTGYLGNRLERYELDSSGSE